MVGIQEPWEKQGDAEAPRKRKNEVEMLDESVKNPGPSRTRQGIQKGETSILDFILV